DPDGLLNPGKIVDAPPLTANLRFGPAYVTPDVPTTFDFSGDGGMVRAAALCSGVGECRKHREGNLCPSYRATRDRRHTTRGRAPVSDWLLRNPPTRWLNEKLLGIDRRRVPPPFARRRPLPAPGNATGPPVVLFPDTFGRFHEPHVADAAHRLLTAAGFRVEAG